MSSKEQSAQAEVDQIQSQVSEIKKQQETLKAENDRLNEESAKLQQRLKSFLKILLLVKNHWQTKHVVLKQQELLQVTLTPL